MKFLFIFVFIFTVFQSINADAKDDWFGRDKFYHFSFSMITGQTAFATSAYFIDKKPIYTHSAISLASGIIDSPLPRGHKPFHHE